MSGRDPDLVGRGTSEEGAGMAVGPVAAIVAQLQPSDARGTSCGRGFA